MFIDLKKSAFCDREERSVNPDVGAMKISRRKDTERASNMQPGSEDVLRELLSHS